MSKKVIKMNESALHSLIKESIGGVISEMDEGKYTNNKDFFEGAGGRKAHKGEHVYKHTNPGANEKALEKHNARVGKHLPAIMDSDKLKAREAQIGSSKRSGMSRENFQDTLEGKLKNKKQEYKQVSESDLHRIVKESVKKVVNERAVGNFRKGHNPPVFNQEPFVTDRKYVKLVNQISNSVHDLFMMAQEERDERYRRFYNLADALLSVLEKYGLQDGTNF